MRLWTYLLPAGLWLWLVRRHCERVTLAGVVASNAGRVLIILPADLQHHRA